MTLLSRAEVRVSVVLFAVVFVFAALIASACSGGGTNAGAPGADGGADTSVDDGGVVATEDAGADWLAPPPIVRDAGEATLAPLRAACTFEAGAWPAETLGIEDPVGSDIPINHIIVIMQENRSFDHYLGRLVAQGYYKPGDFTVTVDGGVDAGGDDAGGADAAADAAAEDAGSVGEDAGYFGLPGSGFAHSDEIDGPPPGWSNPDGDGGFVYPHPDDEHCYGVDHSWTGQHNDFDNGKNDGFVIQNNPDGERTFFYEDDTVIPFYYALASTFSVGDQYHCSVLGPTWPNRYYLMAATSFGIADNSFCILDTSAHPVTQIFGLLDQGGHSWRDYTDGPHMVEFFSYYGFLSSTFPHLKTLDCGLMADIANNTLPDVSFVMGDEVSEDSDEGPADLPQIGGQLVEQIIRNLFASPAWKDTAVFITYDENGGLADHVPAAPACEPDGLTPYQTSSSSSATYPVPGAFNTTGFRVPFIVISPYAKAHYASHVVHDHTSITRFIEARFGLPAMTGRDANATPPYEMFDFQNPPFMTPPNITAHTTVPPTILAQCNQSVAPLSCPDGSQ
jgi:phospholipase C